MEEDILNYLPTVMFHVSTVGIKKKIFKKILFKKIKFFSLCYPKGTHGFPQKCQPIRYSRLARNSYHIYKQIYMSEELVIICTGRAERRFGRTIALSQERSHRSEKNNGTQRTRS